MTVTLTVGVVESLGVTVIALSAVTLRNARPKARPYRLTDERGLYALVQPSGAIWWRFDYRFGPKRKTLSLGVYPDVPLAAAREARDLARTQVAAAIDPSLLRRAAADIVDHRLETLARGWHELRKDGWTEDHADQIIRRLETNVFPALGQMLVQDVTAAELLNVLRSIEARGSYAMAHRVAGYLSGVFGYAIGLGLITIDPVELIRKAEMLRTKPQTRHFRKVKPENIGYLVSDLRDMGGIDATRQAMLLTLLTAVRTVETRFAHRDEFDLDGAEWVIPGERMKMDRDHIVPLSHQAVALLRQIFERIGGRGLLFPRKTKSGVLSEGTMREALRALGYGGKTTVHGFRGTFSTWANEQTIIVDGESVRRFDKDWIERQLAHVSRGVRAAYNAAEYLPARRRLLQHWADYLDQQEEAARLIG